MPATPFALDTSPLASESIKIAEVELNETPERIEQSVAKLRELLHDNSDLHYPEDEYTLKLFLRPCHYYPESAIKLVRIDAKCVMRMEYVIFRYFFGGVHVVIWCCTHGTSAEIKRYFYCFFLLLLVYGWNFKGNFRIELRMLNASF